METSSRPPRAHLLDEIRGLAILLMVIYHMFFDLVYIFGVNVPAFHWPIIDFAQTFVAGCFIFISGIASRYSRSNLRRGCIALGLGLAVSLVTYLFMPGQMIWFGILHFLGTCMILFGLLRKVLDRIPPIAGLILSVFLYICTRDVPYGTLGPSFLPGIPLPATDNLLWLPLGLVRGGSDYFPLLPWMFLFVAGTFGGTYFVKGRMGAAWYKPHLPWLAAVGKHTIVIYLLHQPVVYGVLWVIFWLIR